MKHKKFIQSFRWFDLELYLRKTRFLFVLLCCTMFTTVISAQKISISIQSGSVLDVMSIIEKQSDYRFAYSDSFVDLNKSTSIKKQNAEIDDVLLAMLGDTKLTYNKSGNVIVLLPEENKSKKSGNKSSFAPQNKTVKGSVKDTEGTPMVGVTVRILGTQKGTVTDYDGNFTIVGIEAGQKVEFSFIGMKTEQIDFTGQSNIALQMKADAIGLDEIVAVGYGTQRKSDVTGAIGVVTAEDLQERPSFNALQGMKGKASGVNVFSNSGSPTGSPRVLIRGIGTINSSSNPLFIVDGVAMDDIKYLSPNDIERMEVLKDASATAIYGARGANGVILVSTKRGTKMNKTIVSYDGFVSMGNLANEMDVMNADEWLTALDRSYANATKYNSSITTNPIATRSDPNLFDTNGNPLYDTNWQKEATRTAISHNHQISVQQGDEKSQLGLFVNYSDNEGIMINSYMNRVSAKIAYDVSPREWFTFGINLLMNRVKENESEETGGHQMPRRSMIEMLPIFPVQFPDGTWSNSQTITDDYGLEGMANPVHVLKTQERLRQRTQYFGNTYLNFHIVDGLDLKTQFGWDINDFNRKDYSPTDLINISAPNGYAAIENSLSNYWQQETFVNYNKTLEKHRINAVLGLSWQEKTTEGSVMSARGFADDKFKYNNIGSASDPDAPSSYYDSWSMNSYFARAGYTYNDRYLFTATVRIDGSSRFGENNKYGVFPSLGAGWLISEEGFMQDVEWLDVLKVRSSYGVTGNTEIGSYQSMATVSSGTSLIGGSRETISYTTRLANPDLEWEKTHQFDVGTNISLFKGAVSFEFDYYYKLTKDLLLGKPVPHSTGFSEVLDNIGEVSNQGMDILVSTRNIQNNDFEWTSTLNMNYNTNKIEALGSNDEDIFPGPWWVSGSQIILRVGESLGSFYGYERMGTWNTSETTEAAAVGAVPGVAKRSTEKKIIGKGTPDWTGSFINNFQYKNWDCSVDLQFTMGVEVLQQFFHSTEDRFGYANGLSTILYDSWTENNQNTMVQEIRSAPLTGQSSEIDSHWTANGSYLRVNNISIGYTFDKLKLDRLGFSSARVYGSCDNVALFHSDEFKGFDPEGTSQGSNQWGQNMIFFQYPKPRTFTLGLGLKF